MQGISLVMMLFFKVRVNAMRAAFLLLAFTGSGAFGMNSEQLFVHHLTRIEQFRYALPLSRGIMTLFNAVNTAAEEPYLSDLSAIICLEHCLGELKEELKSSISIKDEDQRSLLDAVKAAHRGAQEKLAQLNAQQTDATSNEQQLDAMSNNQQVTEIPAMYAYHPLAQGHRVGKSAKKVTELELAMLYEKNSNV